MSDEFKVQWSVSLPPVAQYAKGHMLNIRGNTVADVEGQFDEILEDHSEFIRKATDVAALVVGAQTVADTFKGGNDAAPAQGSSEGSTSTPPSTGSGHFCEHGQRVYKTGHGNKGKWEAYFCPLDKNAPNKCDPVWV